jgi:hypothetical protein
MCAVLLAAGGGCVDGKIGVSGLDPAGGGQVPGEMVGQRPPGSPELPPGSSEDPPSTPAGPKPVPSAEGTFACDGSLPTSPARLRRLTAVQWNNTITALGVSPAGPGRVNPFDDGLASGKFSSDVSKVGVPVESLSLLLDAAEAVAGDLAVAVKAGAPCLAAAAPNRACIEGVLGGIGTKAFRRPITTEELARYSQFFLTETPAEGSDSALKLVLSAILSSPHFAFRWERGSGTPDAAGRVKLTGWELASAISYTLVDGPPDAALLAAATANQLTTAEQIKTHVVRLLGGDGKNPAAGRFFREMFRYPLAAGVSKDPKLYPFHKGPLLVEDTELFLQQAFAKRGDFLQTLFASPSGMARSETAASYGLTMASAQPVEAAFPDGQRAGILTQPSFLVAFSGNENNLPVHRGRFISENVLCQPVPDIPLTEIPPLPPMTNATMREKLAVHSEMPQCAACHSKMDPFGLALEQYDHTGRYRTTGEAGKRIDASSVLTGAGTTVDGPFSGPVELGQKLAQSGVVRQCFVLQSLRHWLGRDEQTADGCALKAADEAFSASGGDVVELFVSLLTSDAFLYRTVQ